MRRWYVNAKPRITLGDGLKYLSVDGPFLTAKEAGKFADQSRGEREWKMVCIYSKVTGDKST